MSSPLVKRKSLAHRRHDLVTLSQSLLRQCCHVLVGAPERKPSRSLRGGSASRSRRLGRARNSQPIRECLVAERRSTSATGRLECGSSNPATTAERIAGDVVRSLDMCMLCSHPCRGCCWGHCLFVRSGVVWFPFSRKLHLQLEFGYIHEAVRHQCLRP